MNTQKELYELNKLKLEDLKSSATTTLDYIKQDIQVGLLHDATSKMGTLMDHLSKAMAVQSYMFAMKQMVEANKELIEKGEK